VKTAITLLFTFCCIAPVFGQTEVPLSPGQTAAQAPDASESEVRERAKQGDAEAQYTLGIWYGDGLHGVKQDMDQATAWLRKAGEQEHIGAQRRLSSMYWHGLGVERNQKESVAWLRKAAEQGDADSQYGLGWLYAQGSGVAQDKTQAIAWWRNTTLARLMRKVLVLSRTLSKLSSGIAKPLSKGILRHNLRLAECTRKVVALSETLKKQRNGIARDRLMPR
jgi:hypothetical protein